jgi:cyclopropane fatty-acyl-phospholipid synthase-like methyltransferase
MSMMNRPGNRSLPSSEACERNKGPILDVLTTHMPAVGNVLEIGSGTGQHAVFFAAQFPDLRWQPSDMGDYLPGLRARVAAEGSVNVAPVIELDVRETTWPRSPFAAVFSANTLHFMSTAAAEGFFRGVGQLLIDSGVLIVYGPFKYKGEFTTPSNADFDDWLKSSDPDRGVRDFEWVNELAEQSGLRLTADVAMPANNQCLVWHKSAVR